MLCPFRGIHAQGRGVLVVARRRKLHQDESGHAHVHVRPDWLSSRQGQHHAGARYAGPGFASSTEEAQTKSDLSLGPDHEDWPQKIPQNVFFASSLFWRRGRQTNNFRCWMWDFDVLTPRNEMKCNTKQAASFSCIFSSHLFFSFSAIHSMLYVNFTLKRHAGYFLINVYIPCSLLVVISWVAFWINREATGDRIALGQNLLWIPTNRFDLNVTSNCIGATDPCSESNKVRDPCSWWSDLSSPWSWFRLHTRKEISFFSCEISPSTAFGFRIFIFEGVTTVLTMTFLALDNRTDLPKVSYSTALDIFVGKFEEKH